eukprot:8831_1
MDSIQTIVFGSFNALYSHFDWINNIKPESAEKTASHWSNRDGVSLCCTINRFTVLDDPNTSVCHRHGVCRCSGDCHCNDEDHDHDIYTKEAQISYFSSDPVHDWAASLYVVEEHLKKMQKYYENTLNRTLTHFYGYSDRGEFGCSAFLVGLGHIKQKLGLRELFWTFTCPL